ncbi:MAG: multidrug/biocide efflux PACE transporter [Polaromonas sp.]|nr:multidrug/biocide efflux PACE transporter [Polaromonas sp.]
MGNSDKNADPNTSHPEKSPKSLQKSVKDRFFHALGFEVLAIAICAPLGAWLLGHSLAHMGLLTLMISLIAMVWNMVFNAMFDCAQRRLGFRRTLGARAVHSVIFEIGLILAVVPLAAWWLGIGLWEAFVLDIGIVLFFLPYTFAFNWSYDHLRAIIVARQVRKKALSAA